ncbi:MAG: hypothetical protein PHF86_10440 [Candidatus Nanoarchaeia archaeon]|nr:hypothetical protein [Candidatus Nanoarchaeia archaeon]
MQTYSEDEIAYIIKLKEQASLSWVEIAYDFNKKFKENKTHENLRHCYEYYKNYFEQDDGQVQMLKQLHRTKKNSSYTAKENKTILDHWNGRDDILETIKEVIREISLNKYKVPKIKVDSKKDNMTLEILLGDIHFGKLIKNNDGKVLVNCEEIRRRIRKLSSQIIKEIERNGKYFNVERLIVNILGDIIESSHMHGIESLKSSEFGTSKQVFEAIQSLFEDFFVPLSATGIKIDVSCVTGNHDRVGDKATYVRPGEENLTYIIYKTLQLLCQSSNLTNIDFNITMKSYNMTKVYGNIIITEHGEELKNLNRDTLANLMNKRQTQVGEIVNFYRVGHWHEHITYGQGKMQVNGCLYGQDDYSEKKGFDSEALQILNYYVQTDKRRTCFFRSFPIYLQEKINS